MLWSLLEDNQRNVMIVGDVLEAVKERRSPLLTERREHVQWFADHLRGKVEHVIVKGDYFRWPLPRGRF